MRADHKIFLSILLMTSILFAGCGALNNLVPNANTRSSSTRQNRNSGAERDLRVEKNTKMLTPTEVKTSVGPGSEMSAGGVQSDLQEKQVATSEVKQINQILTEFNAKKTEEGILINLPESILFDFDKYDIRADARETLEKISKLIQHYSKSPIAIYGHTDNKGTDDYNQQLSEKRANSVKNYVAEKFGISANRLETKGFGETKPIAPNAKPDGSDDPEGRQKNRRVEVIIRNA